MKKNLLLTTLLALTLTACGKTAEEEVPESTVAVEETIVEESTIEEVEEESTTEEEETLAMTEEEIVAFLEQVRDMNYESYTFRRAQYFTDCLDSEGNPTDDFVWEDTYVSVDEDGNILLERQDLKNGIITEDGTEIKLVDNTCEKVYLLEDDTYATNDSDVENADWEGTREFIDKSYLTYAKFFDCYPSISIETIAQKAVVTEYNGRPVLYIYNITDDTEKSYLSSFYTDADKLVPVENTLTYDVYLYLDTPGEYVSHETIRYSGDPGWVETMHDVYEMSNVNNTELPEIPENYIRY